LLDPGPDELVKVVALDGPAGTGKSSVSRRVARELGWRFVDTGATYRAVTLAVLRAGVDPANPTGVLATARAASVQLVTDPDAPAVHLDGVDVSAEIRSPEVTAAVSAVSAVPAVRALLIDLQRRAMGVEGAVVEGRDIATVVAPRAAVKVYLDARPEVRAQRRASETHAGEHVTPPEAIAKAVGRDLARRDRLDNYTNPLAASHGAVYVDTSDLVLAEVVQVIVLLVRRAGLVPT
jgi:cytidylate kinase